MNTSKTTPKLFNDGNGLTKQPAARIYVSSFAGKESDMDVMQRLRQFTYATQYSPNCTDPFLVRLVGPGICMLDLLQSNDTNDIRGYGKTERLVARQALALKRKAVRARQAEVRKNLYEFRHPAQRKTAVA
jgi:hypothetical protein